MQYYGNIQANWSDILANLSDIQANLSDIQVNPCTLLAWVGGEVLPIMAYTGRLHPKGVPFSGFRYIKG